MFRRLAESFLGMELSVNLHSKGPAAAATLSLDLKGISRRADHELSESQRFFLDIALRMALSQHMSDESAKACLLLDTPEGSLDIAYEDKAGEMIAQYIDAGHNVIMTANINTSRLLQGLALHAGSKNMKLVRMTQWAQLSDVQLENKHLFDQAFHSLEERLKSGRDEG